MITITDTPAATVTRSPLTEWLAEQTDALGQVVRLIEPLILPRHNQHAAAAVMRIRRAMNEITDAGHELAHVGPHPQGELPAGAGRANDPDDTARLAIANADLADSRADRAQLAVRNAELCARIDRLTSELAAAHERVDGINRFNADFQDDRDKLRAEVLDIHKKWMAENDRAEHAVNKLTNCESDLAVAQRALDDHKNDAERIRILEIDAAHAEKLRAENKRLKAKLADLKTQPATPTKPPAITRTLALARFTELAKRLDDQAASVKSRDVNIAMRACAKALRAEITAAKGPTP